MNSTVYVDILFDICYQGSFLLIISPAAVYKAHLFYEHNHANSYAYRMNTSGSEVSGKNSRKKFKAKKYSSIQKAAISV